MTVIGTVIVVRIFLENDKVLAPQLTLYIKLRENAFTFLSVRSVLTMKYRAKFHYLNAPKASSCLAIHRGQIQFRRDQSKVGIYYNKSPFNRQCLNSYYMFSWSFCAASLLVFLLNSIWQKLQKELRSKVSFCFSFQRDHFLLHVSLSTASPLHFPT